MSALGGTVLDAMTRISSVRQIGDLKPQIARMLEVLGFDSYGLGDLTRPGAGAGPDDDIVMYVNHWPDGWVDSYFDDGIAEIDYLLPETLRRRAPFTWAEADRRHSDSPGAPGCGTRCASSDGPTAWCSRSISRAGRSA